MVRLPRQPTSGLRAHEDVAVQASRDPACKPSSPQALSPGNRVTGSRNAHLIDRNQELLAARSLVPGLPLVQSWSQVDRRRVRSRTKFLERAIITAISSTILHDGGVDKRKSPGRREDCRNHPGAPTQRRSHLSCGGCVMEG